MPKPLRPVPADFAAFMQAKPSIVAACQHYRTGETVVHRWIEETGARHKRTKGFVGRPVPDDFAEKAKVCPRVKLEQIYGVGHNVIRRWCKIAGVAPLSCVRPVPDDFAERAATSLKQQMRVHYNVGHDTIQRWLDEAGIEALQYNRPRREKGPRVGSSPRPEPLRSQLKPYTPTQARERHRDRFDMAADDLRRNRWVVYRCDDRGRADLKGKFWRAGNTILTPDELLARAGRYQRAAA